MAKKVYDVPNMMTNILSIKRFIADGGGLYLGSEDQFIDWLAEVNRVIGHLGLHIDESCFRTNSNFINVLDILYCFDITRKLTDGSVPEGDRFKSVPQFFKCTP